MTVDSLKEGTDPEVLRIGLSDGSLFFFRTAYVSSLPEGGFFPGLELSDQEVAALKYSAVCFRAERAALRLVARAEQNTFGIKHKLERRGFPRDIITRVVSRLESIEIISDRRFSERWLRYRLSVRPDSPFRLINALCVRGISRSLASETLAVLLDFETEMELLGRYLDKKKLVLEDKNPSVRYQLKREGFSPTCIDDYIANK